MITVQEMAVFNGYILKLGIEQLANFIEEDKVNKN